MNINVTVTLTASAELSKLLKGIAAALAPGQVTTEPSVEIKLPAEAPAAKNGKAKAAPVVTATVPPVVDETPATDITLEDIRKIATEKTQAGKRDALKALLTEFGVAKVSDLQPSQFANFKQKVEAV